MIKRNDPELLDLILEYASTDEIIKMLADNTNDEYSFAVNDNELDPRIIIELGRIFDSSSFKSGQQNKLF